ncbi:MAG: O-antigen ligase family protein [Lachnospiraceae bacterium]|nr:O-antigen ligase family protein [Lachnospiraceae bacterium]
MKERIRKTGWLLLTAWIFVLLPILWFYAPEGYEALGEHKFEAWRMISAFFAAPLLICLLLLLIPAKHKENDFSQRPHLLLPDIFLILYSLLITVSFLLSPYRGESLWGTRGWRTGYLTELMMIAFYLFARVFPLHLPAVLCSAGISSAALLFIAITDRFGFYLFPWQGGDSSFVATIGNMDWYAGCLALMLAFSAGLFVFSLSAADGQRTVRKKRLFLSGILVFAAILSAYTQSSVTGYLLPVLTLLCLLFTESDRIPAGKWLRCASGGLLIPAAAGMLLLPVFQTAGVFSDSFGNGRGAIWRISWLLAEARSPMQTAFGIGPGAFAAYAYQQDSPFWPQLYSAFGPVRLTNAHHALMTVFLEEGLFAAVVWLLFVLSSFLMLLRAYRNRRHPLMLIALLSIVLLGAVQALTFRTVTATPVLLFLSGSAIKAGNPRTERT